MSTADFDFAMMITRMVIISIGTLGNILSFVIFSRNTFRKNSISTYCQALAIFDCFAIVDLIVSSAYLGSNSTVFLPFTSDAWCKFYIYSSVGFSTIPAWILVAFSIDKTLSMRRSSIQILKKKWFQWSVVSFVVLFNFFLYLEVPILLKLEPYPPFPVIYYCDLSTIKYFDVIILVYLFESNIIPFLAMIATSTAIIRNIYHSRKTVERAGKIDKERRSRDSRFAISSLAFNVLYVVFKLPLAVYYILNEYNINLGDYFQQIAMFAFFLNSSSSFFIHFFSNGLFRKEFFILFRLRSFNRVSTSNSTHFKTTLHRIDTHKSKE